MTSVGSGMANNLLHSPMSCQESNIFCFNAAISSFKEDSAVSVEFLEWQMLQDSLWMKDIMHLLTMWLPVFILCGSSHLVRLSKWVITPVISRLTPLIPFITRVVTHLLSGMSHQVGFQHEENYHPWGGAGFRNQPQYFSTMGPRLRNG